jgi:hypothetical protein
MLFGLTVKQRRRRKIVDEASCYAGVISFKIDVFDNNECIVVVSYEAVDRSSIIFVHFLMPLSVRKRESGEEGIFRVCLL